MNVLLSDASNHSFSYTENTDNVYNLVIRLINFGFNHGAIKNIMLCSFLACIRIQTCVRNFVDYWSAVTLLSLVVLEKGKLFLCFIYLCLEFVSYREGKGGDVEGE